MPNGDSLSPDLTGLARQAPVPYSSPTGAFITGLPTVGNRPPGYEWSNPLTPPQPQLPPRPQQDPNRWFSPNLQGVSSAPIAPTLGSIMLARMPPETDPNPGWGTKNFNMLNEYGQHMGELRTSQGSEPDIVKIEWAGPGEEASGGGPWSIGPGEWQSALREMLREWPNMKRIEGEHIGGSGVWKNRKRQEFLRDVPELEPLPSLPPEVETMLNEELGKIIKEQVVPNRGVGQGEILPPRSPQPPRSPSTVSAFPIQRLSGVDPTYPNLRASAERMGDTRMVNMIDAINRARGMHPGGHGQESPLEPEE